MKSIIITGATSGIGYQCALHTARIAPNEQLIIACRDLKAGKDTIQKIADKTGHQNLRSMLLDLDSLASIRAFKTEFSKLEHSNIIALINNAGMQNIGPIQYTKDGFERSFGVNHLASLYLTLLLLPLMDDQASITFTASGVHDPKQKSGIEFPVFTTVKELAYPQPSDEKLNILGQRRYSTSKLCNVLTTYELQNRLSHTNIRVNAFDPGLVPGTGLARTYTPFLRLVWNYVFPALRLFMKNVNSAPDSGKRLANLASAPAYAHYRGKYFEGAKEIPSSADSYKQEFQHSLWNNSIDLLGVKQQDTSVPLT